jgi:hypothetical protein
MGKILIAGLVLGLTGCAVAHKTVMPDGRQGLSINCSGSAMAWNQCYEKAGEQCPHGYDVISKDGDGGNAVAGGNGSFWAAGSANTRSMLIACKVTNQ